MVEAIYFEESDVQVTSAKIVTPWGVYVSKDLRSVDLEDVKGVRRLLRRIILVVGIATYLLWLVGIFTGVLSASGSGSILILISVACGVLNSFVIRPILKVKIHGAFGLVTFDCGDNYRYAKKLAKALTALLNTEERHLENTPGAA